MNTHTPPIEINPPTTPQATVLWLHGLGADGNDFAGIVPQLQLPNVRFIFPHAPVRPITLNQGYPMRAWFDIAQLVLHAEIDHLGLSGSEEIITTLIQQELKRGIPSEKILLAGFSQGGALALHCAMQSPVRLGGVIALSTYLPTSKDPLTTTHPFPLFMAHGKSDPLIPFAWAKNTVERLAALNLPITWREYPIPHTVSQQEIEDIAEWLRERISSLCES